MPLFVRKSKGVTLTAAGEELYSVLAGGFSRFSEVVRSLKRGASARNVTIACSDVFGTMWLIPRMPDFWRNSSDITVDHLISDDVKNFRRAEVELRIRYGMGGLDRRNRRVLVRRVLVSGLQPWFFRGAQRCHGVRPRSASASACGLGNTRLDGLGRNPVPRRRRSTEHRGTPFWEIQCGASSRHR
ncbi:hypothetical protein Q1M63_03390 (plasmid) [Sinorhizobium meliloti]|nr:hypothetical protein Q1M63_03390 [Sinorhizobium meliloti]